MNKVIFEIDPEKEYEYHQLFLNVSGFNRMSLFADTSIADKKRILKKIECFWDTEDKIIIDQIESKWREIEKEYFQLIKEVTQVDWLYQNYYAYFLAFCKIAGFSNPFNLRSKEIILTTDAVVNPKFLVGHELFHSHYYYIVDKLGMAPRLNKTLFIEGVAALALSDPRIKELFAGTDFQNSIDSYPIVSKNWNIFQELWAKKNDFESFLLEAEKTLSNSENFK